MDKRVLVFATLALVGVCVLNSWVAKAKARKAQQNLNDFAKNCVDDYARQHFPEAHKVCAKHRLQPAG